MRAAKVQASLRIQALSQEEPSDRKPDPWPSEWLGMRS